MVVPGRGASVRNIVVLLSAVGNAEEALYLRSLPFPRVDSRVNRFRLSMKNIFCIDRFSDNLTAVTRCVPRESTPTMAKTDPAAAELAEKMVQVLRDRRGQGEDAYPPTLKRLVE